MTENEIRQKVVDTAKAWLGYKQSNGSYEVIIDTYNGHKPLARGYAVKKYSDAWCATYVSAVAIKCGLTDIMFTECSCPQMINLYNKAGRWVENDAYADVKPGDIVMYDWGDVNAAAENKGTPDHVGVVTAISGNTMTIIEGNLNHAVGTRSLKVNGLYIRGYCCPDYASKADGKPAKTDDTIYTVEASGEFNSKAEAESALKKVEALGFTGSVATSGTETTAKEITVGSKVKVKQGAKYYDGKTPNPIVYNREHIVHSMKGDRVVIAVGKTIIGAVHKDNLTLIEG